MRKEKWDNRKKCFVIKMILISGTVFMLSGYITYWGRVPEKIQVEKGTTQHIFLQVPAQGVLYQENSKEQVAEVFLEHPITVTAGEESAVYQLPLKLYGIIPFKQIHVEVVEENQIYLVGNAFGFYLETEGVLVVGIGEYQNELNELVAPAKGVLMVGDEIISVDHIKVSEKQELAERLNLYPGKPLQMEVKRNGELLELTVTPEKNAQGITKLGIWVRDNAQGVGTITYVDRQGYFGALGHPIMDSDTKEKLPMESGRLYATKIVEIKPGQKNHIGEMTGVIDYSQSNIYGELYENQERGIFGYSERLAMDYTNAEAVSIGRRYETHLGEAWICSSISGEKKLYNAKILSIKQGDHSNRAITLQVKDPNLISLTGGIVQGMSGSPIIQDHKLVGAITHVFLSDPTKGYGVLIEDMMEDQRYFAKTR